MNSSKTVLVSLLLALILLSACSPSNSEAIAKKTVVESASLMTNNTAVIIDVRSVSEWNNKHIPGAILIPIDELTNRLSELNQYQDKQLIMHCAVGGRSSKAVEILQQAGFKNVSNMDGGIVAWEKAKLPLE